MVQLTNEWSKMTELAGKLGVIQDDLVALSAADGAFASAGGPVDARGSEADAMALGAGAAAPPPRPVPL